MLFFDSNLSPRLIYYARSSSRVCACGNCKSFSPQFALPSRCSSWISASLRMEIDQTRTTKFRNTFAHTSFRHIGGKIFLTARYTLYASALPIRSCPMTRPSIALYLYARHQGYAIHYCQWYVMVSIPNDQWSKLTYSTVGEAIMRSHMSSVGLS